MVSLSVFSSNHRIGLKKHKSYWTFVYSNVWAGEKKKITEHDFELLLLKPAFYLELKTKPKKPPKNLNVYFDIQCLVWNTVTVCPCSKYHTCGSHIARVRRIPIPETLINDSVLTEFVKNWFICDRCIFVLRLKLNSNLGSRPFLIQMRTLLLLHWTDKALVYGTHSSRPKPYQGSIKWYDGRRTMNV